MITQLRVYAVDKLYPRNIFRVRPMVTVHLFFPLFFFTNFCGFGLCEPKSDNIIRVPVVWLLPSANQSSGSLVPGSRTASSRRQTRHIDNYARTSTWTKYLHLGYLGFGLSSATSAFGYVFCSFVLRVLWKVVNKATRPDLIILISGPSEHKYKQWKQSSASPPWPWPSPASQPMNSVRVPL